MPDASASIPTTEEDGLGAHEALMQFLYRAPIGLVSAKLDGTVEMINPKAAQLLMPIARDLDNLFDVFAELAPELLTRAMAFEHASGPICQSLRVNVPALAGRPARVLSIDLTKLDGTSLMAVIDDTTLDSEREEQNLARQLRHAARVDTLTSLPNRTALLEQVRGVLDLEAIDDGYEFAVLYLNCDRFGQINDGFGRPVGDEVLAMVAGRLRATLRPHDCVGRSSANDTVAARVSGDEFVVLLQGLAHGADVHLVASRLLEALARPYVVGTHQLFCSASIGIVTRRHDTGDADALLQDASIAMDAAKRAGGARYVVFESSMRERAVQRGGIEVELRRAIADRQLFVVYQPVVGLRVDGVIDRMAGVEALVRWRHPTRGVVPPIEFIGVAEETGLIGRLGDFVLETACRQFVEWRRTLGDRAPRLLAVNLSRAQLVDEAFVGSVHDVLVATGMPASQLQLEVTESLAAQDEDVQQRLHDLRSFGITLALDDFGTGYSSLSSLHLLPVGTVKIDRSFVHLADTSAHHRVLIEATVRVARSLGMGTVAEGIETQAQAAVIRALGCDKGQGYLFGRPLTSEDATAWLTAGSCEVS